MPKSIIIADDHLLMRQSLCITIENESDYRVLGLAGDGRTAVRMSHELSPDMVLMDVSMPDLNGIEATRVLKSEIPTIKVIGLSMHGDARYVVGMFQAGANGYVLKNCSTSELIEAIRTVFLGRRFLCNDISDVVIHAMLNPIDSEVFLRSHTLTPREREVIQLIAEGKTTKVIADQLHVSTKTIETHRRQIMLKLNVHSIAELTKFAVREGISAL